jgi:D-threo-aldose 1-dehydrogenase
MHVGDRVRLGTTDVHVSRLGLGCASLGGWPDRITYDEAARTIEAAWETGVRYFDVAPLYGYGQAERWLGRALRAYPRDEYVILTKVGFLLRPGDPDEPSMYRMAGRNPLRPVRDDSADGVGASLTESIERLGCERIDIALIHDPEDWMDAAMEGTYAGLRALRAEGVVGAIGLGMNYPAPMTSLLRRAAFDCLLIAGRYTLLDQEALVELLPTALKLGVSIIAGGVYNSGILADPDRSPRFHYAPAAEDVLATARRMREVCVRHGVTLGAAAIQFPFGHPAVAAVVVGAQHAAEVRENAANLEMPVPGGLWQELRAGGLLPSPVPVPAAE